MTKKELKSKILKEYSDMMQWDKMDFGHCSTLMFDASNGAVWADCFVTENNWKVYQSVTIYPVNISDLIYQHTADYMLKNSEIIDIITDYIASKCNSGIITD